MSTSTELQWKLDKLGQWSDPAEFEVTREKIIAYAEATNDEHPAHRSGELAPPVFPVVGALLDASESVAKVTHSLWDAGGGRVMFETVSDNGNVAIKDGLAEVA
jgi:hypothetical protein